MAELAPYTDATFKLQFRTSLPTGEESRQEREQEHADLLSRIKAAVHAAIESSQEPGWEVVLVEEATYAAAGSSKPSE
jgi:hypothetical protein